jgi:hypothetical protein
MSSAWRILTSSAVRQLFMGYDLFAAGLVEMLA